MIPSGHFGLILFTSKNEPYSHFYLSVPVEIVYKLCIKPRKYLLYLGWCILGVEGSLTLESTGENLNVDGDVDESEIYRYVTKPSMLLFTDSAICTRNLFYLSIEDTMFPVDIEVIKSRTHVPSETTRTREDFCNRLLQRDVRCVFTATRTKFGDASHIIPHRRGSEVRLYILVLSISDLVHHPLTIPVASTYLKQSSAI